jgi:N-acetylglucosamine kinase-like BadF-type ATPase
MAQTLLLGIDGGGTSTTCWLADGDGKCLGRGVAGPSNAKSIGADAAHAALDLAIGSAFQNAGLTRATVASACFGLAGFDRHDERALLQHWNNQSGWSRRLTTGNDADLVLAAGTPDGFGIALISGTGSIAYGRAPDGRIARAGGYGPLFSDEGSAYAVSITALTLVAKRADGRAAPPVSDELSKVAFQRTASTDLNQLISHIYSPAWDRSRIASLAPSLVLAAENDLEATRLLIEQPAKQLVELVVTVSRQLHQGNKLLHLALAGGFLLNCEHVRNAVECELGAWLPGVECCLVEDPVAGAIILAQTAISE